MSKTIKAIKCPQCKSTKNTFLGDDKYQCSHCGAEFILDNDDVNIFINKRHESPVNNAATVPRVVIPIIGFLFTIGVIIFVLVFAHTKDRDYNGIKSTTNRETLVAIPNSMNIISGRETDKPLYIMAAKQVVSKRNQVQSNQVLIYDIMRQKLLKEIPIESKTKLSIKAFSDTTIYLISDTRVLYQLNPVSLELMNITNTLKMNYNQLSSGVSSIDFSPEAKALTVITNEGKTYTLFPEIQKAYTMTELTELKQTYPNKPKMTGDILYVDSFGLLVNDKDSTGIGFIMEYIDSKTQESTWKITSTDKVEQAKPYKNGFILIDNTVRQITIVQENGKYKQIQLP